MDALAWAAVAVFVVTILVVITNVVDSTVAALIGVVVMVWIGVMSDVDAFGLVDWNVMAILVSVWIMAAYFGKTRRYESQLTRVVYSTEMDQTQILWPPEGEVPAKDRPVLYTKLQKNFDAIFTSHDLTSDDVVTNLDKVVNG